MSRSVRLVAPSGMYLKIFLSAAAATSVIALFTAGCGAQLDTVLTSAATNDAGPKTADAGGSGDCESQHCAAPGDAAAPTNDAAAPASTTCVTDPDCNDDPNVSSLHGQCFQGYCFCKQGFYALPSGKCSATVPTCTSSSNAPAHCVTGATCPAGEQAGDRMANQACGDLVQATCCTPVADCRGPDVSCCSKAGGVSDPVCVNGWLQCDSIAVKCNSIACEPATPIAKGSICN